MVASLELQFVQLSYLAEELSSKNKRLSDRLTLVTDEINKIVHAKPELHSVESITSQLMELLANNPSRKTDSDLSEVLSRQEPKQPKPEPLFEARKVVIDNRTGMRCPSLVLDIPFQHRDNPEPSPLGRPDSMDYNQKIPAIQTQINMPNLDRVGSKVIDFDSLYSNDFHALRSNKRYNSSDGSSKHISKENENSLRKIDRKRVPMLSSNKQITIVYNPISRKKSSIDTKQNEQSQDSSLFQLESALIHPREKSTKSRLRDGKQTYPHSAKPHTKLGYEKLLAQDLVGPTSFSREEEYLHTTSLSGRNTKQAKAAAKNAEDHSEDKSESSREQGKQPGEQRKSFFFKSKKANRTSSSVLHKRTVKLSKNGKTESSQKAKPGERPHFTKQGPLRQKLSSDMVDYCFDSRVVQEVQNSTAEFGFEHNPPIEEI